MSLRSLAWLLLVQSLLRHSLGARIPAIIVFGDSTVDSGNNDYISTLLKSNFAPYGRDFQGQRPTGRFSNGRIPTDFMAEALGLKPTVPAYLDPDFSIKEFATGVCFASAGTGYDNATSDVLTVIPMWEELSYFKEYQAKLRNYMGVAKANEILTEALYVMSFGTNDFLENYYTLPGRRMQFRIEEYQSFLIGLCERFIISLHELGGRRLDLTGVPPMGCLPLERARNLMTGSNCNEEYNKVAKDFNHKLQALAAKLNRTLPGMRIAYGNIYDVVDKVVQNPSQYGFENVGVGCCASGLFEMGYMCNKRDLFTCSDASKYVFWDAFHPTEKMAQIVANSIMENMKPIL